jgi:hypothetical protein
MALTDPKWGQTSKKRMLPLIEERQGKPGWLYGGDGTTIVGHKTRRYAVWHAHTALYMCRDCLRVGYRKVHNRFFDHIFIGAYCDKCFIGRAREYLTKEKIWEREEVALQEAAKSNQSLRQLNKLRRETYGKSR